ncbi:hypothetical protein [Microbacterium hominis]|uniref:hypothetical protein n=1 Tax=Microbacterium hominis TaxID=162426 RepID=UPI001CC2F80B|nr:hypothetical protein [Microbacterium hominis]
MQRDRGRRGVGEAAVQLCGALGVGAAHALRLEAVAERRRVAAIGVGDRDDRLRCEHDAPAAQPGADAEVEALVRAGERGVESAQRPPGVGAHEDAADIGAEDVVARVVLTLVVLAVGEPDRAPPWVRETPRETMRSLSSARTSFGAAKATDGEVSSAPRRRMRASGAGVVSWARIHTASPSSRRLARSRASAKEVPRSAVMTPSAPDSPAIRCSSRSPACTPQSTIVSLSTGRDCAASADRTRSRRMSVATRASGRTTSSA